MTKPHTYRPVIYFGLAFLITWIAGGALAYQVSRGAEKSILLLFIGYMGPYIAALLMMYVYADRSFRADFRNRIVNLRRIRPEDVSVVFLILPVAMIVSILISTLAGQPIEQLRFAEAFKVFDGEVVFSMILLALVPILEELGWRGYGVDSLRQKFNLFTASLVFGALWAIWHLPIFFIPGSYQASLWPQNPLYAINFFAGILPLALIMNFLYYRNRRSIALTALFHILVNYSSEIFEATQVSKCILTLVLTLLAAMIVMRNTKFFFESPMAMDVSETTIALSEGAVV